MMASPPRIERSKSSSYATLESHRATLGQEDADAHMKPPGQRISEALVEIHAAAPFVQAATTAKLAALVSPCFFHRRFDDAVDIEKVLDDIASDESMSHSRLLQTATGVREVSKQLQRRPIKRAVRNVMIVTKARENRLVVLTRRLTEWLLSTPRYGSSVGVNVYVDEKLQTSKRFDAEGLLKQEPRFKRMLRYWTPDLCWSSPEKFDLVLTLGGDGTVLFTSWLFQRIVPPILSFSLGSLGFLTPFDFENYREHLNRVMGGLTTGLSSPIRSVNNALSFSSDAPSYRRESVSTSAAATGTTTPIHPSHSDTISDAGMHVNLRMRFTCTVYRSPRISRQSMAGNLATPVATEACQFEVLNELVIDRGPSPYVSNLELFGDDALLTVIQADGVIFSTPTGSTAYSLSAGGSLVHPSIPAILLTPICPHTLSFRPMLLNDTIALRIAVPRGSRAGAWCSFDGKGRIELRQGDYVTIRASRYPFATVMGAKETWIDSVSRTLRWNTREARQKGWNGGGRNKIVTGLGNRIGTGDSGGIIGWEDDDHELDEAYVDSGANENGDMEEEEFDIDFDDEEVPGGATPADSGYSGDGSSAPSPATGDKASATGSPQRKLSLLAL